MSRQRTPSKSKSTWLAIINSYLDSGLSKEIFCKNKSLKLGTFKSWHSRLNPKKNSLQCHRTKNSNFIPVNIIPKAAYSGLQIELPNGIKLAISDIDSENHKLQALLKACCDVVNG